MSMVRTWWDVFLAGALVVLSFVPGVARQGLELAGLPDRPLDLLGVSLIVIQGSGVVLLRRRPAWALALTGSGFAAYQLLGFPTTFAALALLFILVGAGALIERNRVMIAALAVGGYIVLAAALLTFDVELTAVDTLVFGVLLATLWLWGSWLRSQAASRRVRAQTAERDAIAAERARIARELHDVVTHHVTAIIVQAEAGQYQPALDAKTHGILASIAEGGRSTLVDLRSLLGALEASAAGGRAPALQSADEIVASARATGQDVQLVERGKPRALPGAPGLALVRVVQEGITNARKYATDGSACVDIEYAEHAVLVEVASSGLEKGSASTPGGRGIVGMRARVESLGGDLQAGPVGGRFMVRARIPG
ncbi:sensor histidine kinase [Specibacter sp. NPDC057265]|uniref:sensor histidine kinase n=1 Tax=Specibacter sp. NPDC057265 TaxID=3346075 RepID=UPI003641A5C3